MEEINNKLASLDSACGVLFEGNMYIVAPVSLSDERKIKPSSSSNDYVKDLLLNLDNLYSYEVSESLRTDVKRFYLGCLDVCVTDGIDNAQSGHDVCGAFSFLSCHERNGLGVLIVAIPRFQGDISPVLDTMSSETVSIIAQGNPVRLDKYIMDQYGLERVGSYRSLVTSKKDICSEVLISYLAGETYNSEAMSANLRSDWITHYSSRNVAQYDSSDIFIGPKGIVRIDKRKDDESQVPLLSSDMVLFFILELVVYKDAALSRSNLKTLRKLSLNDAVNLQELYKFNLDFGRTIPFWNTNIFNYATAQRLADIMNDVFDINEKYKSYTLNQDYLKARVSLKEAISQDKQQKVLYLIAIVLFFLESLPFFYALIFDFLNGEVAYMKLIAVLGSFATSSFMFVMIVRALKSRIKERKGA